MTYPELQLYTVACYLFALVALGLWASRSDVARRWSDRFDEWNGK